MHAPSGAETIAALGSSARELGQVLALLRAAGVEEPEQLSVSTGDRRLLELHRTITGREIEVAVSCRTCGTVSSALLSPETVPDEAPRVVPLGPGGGLRAPTYGDLLDLPPDPFEAEAELVRRCLVGTPARAALTEELDDVDDSLAGPVLLACVECGEALAAAADVEELVLQSLQQHATEIELDVHLLARAYGWSLETIEALPDERRRRLARFVEDGR